MTQPFVYQRRVEFADTDAGGICHFSSLIRYMEEAEHAFWRSLGLTVHEPVGADRVGWPRVNVHCDFQTPARFEEVLDITVRVERLGGKSVTYALRITCAGRPIAAGTTTAVCCQFDATASIRAVPIPDRIRQQLEASMSESGR